jgi:transcriptional regulator with XRE-family HTH domain
MNGMAYMFLIFTLMKEYSMRIRKFRQLQDYSQEFMAMKMGITMSAYSKIERGKTELTLFRLTQIAEVLQLELMDFLKDEKVAQVAESAIPDYGFVTRGEFAEQAAALQQVQLKLSEILSKLPQ